MRQGKKEKAKRKELLNLSRFENLQSCHSIELKPKDPNSKKRKNNRPRATITYIPDFHKGKVKRNRK